VVFCGRVGGWENNCGKGLCLHHVHLSTGADGVAGMSNLCRLFRLKLADELEERQRRFKPERRQEAKIIGAAKILALLISGSQAVG
jgi:hypothetical protein